MTITKLNLIFTFTHKGSVSSRKIVKMVLNQNVAVLKYYISYQGPKVGFCQLKIVF